MLESKVNQKSIHRAAEATIDPFERNSNDREVRLCQVVWRTSAREHRQEFGCLENAIEFKDRLAPTFKEGAYIVDSKTGEVISDGSEGIPFDAEILYARKSIESNQHPELSRLSTKFGVNVVGYLYTGDNGRVTLQCDTDGHKSVLECDVSFEALLTLPNLRKPCKVTPIPDTTLFEVSDPPKNMGYIVTPEKDMCGCQLTFNHEYECRHLKAVYQYQMEHAVAFRKAAPAEKASARESVKAGKSQTKRGAIPFFPFPLRDDLDATPSASPNKTKERTQSRANDDIMGKMVAKHHPNSLAAADQLNRMPVYCAICSRELTNPESRRVQIGPVCREKVGMRGESHLRGDLVSQKLVKASRLYKDAKSQKWILQGCLQLNAPIPVMVIPQRDTEYWSLKRSPILYYLSKDNKVHCLYKVGRELKYKRITALCRDTELDQMAWKAAKDLIECLEANGGKKPKISYL